MVPGTGPRGPDAGAGRVFLPVWPRGDRAKCHMPEKSGVPRDPSPESTGARERAQELVHPESKPSVVLEGRALGTSQASLTAVARLCSGRGPASSFVSFKNLKTALYFLLMSETAWLEGESHSTQTRLWGLWSL